VSAENWIAVAAIVVTIVLAIIGAVAIWAVRVNKGVSAEKSAEKAHERIDELNSAFGEFRAHVAANYASNTMLDQMEKRVVDAINRLGDRLDRAFERRSKEG
jgi:flagellar basal body-associated protein FliL